MLNRLKRLLVESFIGAIALGYLFAQAILRFADIFSAPVERWVAQKEYLILSPRTPALISFPFEAALPQLVTFVVILLVWYILLRWLYFTPVKKETSEQAPHPEQAA